MKKRLNKIFARAREYSLRRVIILLFALAIGYLMINQWDMIDHSAQFFLKKHQVYVRYLIPLSIILGFMHAYLGNANEHSLYLFKYLGPILASPLTCLTYAIIINSTFALMYIVCYDTETILHYTSIDKTTLTYTLILLLSWSVFGMVKIVMDIVKIKPKEKRGEVLPEDANVNVHEAWELSFWAKEFGVSEEKIIEAVNAVGTSISSVKVYLHK